MEVGQVQAGSSHEDQEEEAPQEKHANKKVRVLFALHVSLQKGVLKVPLLFGPAMTQEQTQHYNHSRTATNTHSWEPPNTTTMFYFWLLGVPDHNTNSTETVGS